MTQLAIVQMSRRERLWHEAGGRCHWCGKHTELINSPLLHQATIDHVIPRCRGGSDREDNVVNSCRQCNLRRNHEDQKRPGHPSHVLVASSAPRPGKVKVLHVSQETVLREQRDASLRRVKELQAQVEALEVNLEAKQRVISAYRTMPILKLAVMRMFGLQPE